MSEPSIATGRRWTIRVPACEWLSANPSSNTNWAGRSRIIRDWRTAVATACLAAKLPTDGVGPVRIHADVRHTGRSPVRDRLNLSPTIKAIVDGLVAPKLYRREGRMFRTVGYGLLADDSDRHVLDTTWTIAPSGTHSSWVDLTITEEVTGGR